MKRVLIITSTFAPTAKPGVYRILKFVKYLPHFGWMSEVLWVHGNRCRPVDRSLLEDIPEGVKVHRVKDNLFHGLFSASAKVFGVPVLRGDQAYFSKALRQAELFHHSNPFDAMLLTAPPLRLPALGIRINNKLRIPWVLDLRDPWGTRTPRLKIRNNREKRFIEEMENTAFASASGIIVVAENLKSEILVDHPELSQKVSVIENGYDEQDFAGVNEPDRNIDEFRIYFGGSLRPGTGYQELVNAFLAVLRENDEIRDTMKIVLSGGRTLELAQKIISNGFSHTVERLRYLSQKDYIREIIRSDVLLFFLPLESKYGPAQKIYIYLRSGRPILGIAPEGGPAADILKNNPRCLFADIYDIEGMKRNIISLYRQWKNAAPGRVASKPELNIRFSRKNQAERLSNILDGVIPRQ